MNKIQYVSSSGISAEYQYEMQPQLDDGLAESSGTTSKTSGSSFDSNASSLSSLKKLKSPNRFEKAHFGFRLYTR